jgi:hypothetical protein
MGVDGQLYRVKRYTTSTGRTGYRWVKVATAAKRAHKRKK